MNPTFLAFAAATSVFLIFWGLTRSAIVGMSRDLEIPDEPDWTPGADAPLVFRVLGTAAYRLNRETGMRNLVDQLPGERLAALDKVIVQAGSPWGVTSRAIYTMQIIGFIGGTVGGIFLMLLLGVDWIFGLGLGVLLGIFPRSYINGRARKRTNEIRRALPSMLDLLVVNAESGRSLRGGFDLVSEKLQGPLADEMAFCSRMLQVGTPEEEAFLMLAERTGLPEIEDLASSLVTSVRFGGVDIRAALRLLARQTRERYRQEIEGSINKLTVKLVFPIFGFLFPSFLILVLGPAMLTFGDSL